MEDLPYDELFAKNMWNSPTFKFPQLYGKARSKG